MPYPERKPIYDTYKAIIDKIIEDKPYKQYAESEIDALNKELLRAFKEISQTHIALKNWSE